MQEREREYSFINFPSLHPASTNPSQPSERLLFYNQARDISRKRPTCFLSVQDLETGQFLSCLWFSFRIFPQVYSDQVGQRKCLSYTVFRAELHEACAYLKCDGYIFKKQMQVSFHVSPAYTQESLYTSKVKPPYFQIF